MPQVPVPLTDNRRRFLAMKWMITECRDNKHRCTHMYEKLSQELLAAFSNEGNVVKRKHDLHKMAEANRAYAHYRWWQRQRDLELDILTLCIKNSGGHYSGCLLSCTCSLPLHKKIKSIQEFFEVSKIDNGVYCIIKNR